MKYFDKFCLGLFMLAIAFPSILRAEVNDLEIWQCGGPDVGYITCMSRSISNPDVIFAGTKSGIYKTSDGGANWTRTNFQNIEVLCIQVHLENPDIVFTGTNRAGLYKTYNGGESWALRGFEDQRVNTIATDPKDAGVLYAGTGDAMRQYDGEIIGIFKSTNTGNVWHELITWDSWGICGWSQVNCILVDPDDSRIIYAGGENSRYCSNFGGFLKSTNSGSSWTDVELIPSSSSDEVYALAITPAGSNPKTLYCINGTLTTKYLSRSENGGNDWSEVTTPSSSAPQLIAVDPKNPSDFYCADKEGFWKWNGQWSSKGGGLPDDIPSSIVFNPDQSEDFYLGYFYSGVYKYLTDRSYWYLFNTGIQDADIRDIVTHPGDQNRAYAVIYSQRLAQTINGGLNWSCLISAPGGSGTIAIAQQSPYTLFFGYEKYSGSSFYIYTSNNSGANWTKIDFASCSGYCSTWLTDILVDQDDPNRFLIGCSYYWTSAGLTGFGMLARTLDGGTNWDQIYSGISTTALAADPNNPSIIYRGKQRFGQIFRVTNTWGSWSINEITPGGGIGDIYDIEVDSDSKVYVAASDGLWSWNGTVWNTFSTFADAEITDIELDHTKTPNFIYVATSGAGIFMSPDGGASWLDINDNIGTLDITKIALSKGSPRILYAGARYGGLWRRTALETGIQFEDPQFADVYGILSNYPNPFNATTTIKFQIQADQYVVIKVFDLRGNEVATLSEQEYRTGSHHIEWNGLDNNNRPVGTGIYFCSLITGNFTSTIKMLYFK